jgi:PBP1b-binding outer membrane lipoprotein LpoB
MKNIIIGVLCIILISGCSLKMASRVDIAKRAKAELIGVSKSEILICAGIPANTYRNNGTEFLTYSNLERSNFYDVMSGPGGGLLQMASQLDECEVTLTLRDNVVESVNFRTNHTGIMASDDQCAYVFESCLTKEAP